MGYNIQTNILVSKRSHKDSISSIGDDQELRELFKCWCWNYLHAYNNKSRGTAQKYFKFVIHESRQLGMTQDYWQSTLAK